MQQQVDAEVPSYQEQRSEAKNRLNRAVAQVWSLKLLNGLADMAEAFAKQEAGKQEQRSKRWR